MVHADGLLQITLWVQCTSTVLHRTMIKEERRQIGVGKKKSATQHNSCDRKEDTVTAADP